MKHYMILSFHMKNGCIIRIYNVWRVLIKTMNALKGFQDKNSIYLFIHVYFHIKNWPFSKSNHVSRTYIIFFSITTTFILIIPISITFYKITSGRIELSMPYRLYRHWKRHEQAIYFQTFARNRMDAKC